MKPNAEVRIDRLLAQALLAEQHADLAELPLTAVGEGWDNALFRLGVDMAIRLPRRSAAAQLIAHEQRWLPQLAERLPLPVPVPLRRGRPGCGFPWPWSIVSWCHGTDVLRTTPSSIESTAVSLGQFVRALHVPAPAGAPTNPWRGVPLDARSPGLHEHVLALGDVRQRRTILDLWHHAVSAAAWPGPPLWIHGDLHPGNLLIRDGQLGAVIDFGDLTAGDPATDLSIAWMLFPRSVRPLFRAAARGDADPIDDATWMRARGWALALGLTFTTAASKDEVLAALGRSTVSAALTDH
jgi:aminoglycoside phosphotransferase (APT) family kinase protein